MKKYLMCVTKRIDKFVGIEAENEKEARKKLLQLVNQKKFNFRSYDKEDVYFEIGRICPEECFEKLKKYLGKEQEKSEKELEKITEEFCELDKKMLAEKSIKI